MNKGLGLHIAIRNGGKSKRDSVGPLMPNEFKQKIIIQKGNKIKKKIKKKVDLVAQREREREIVW